MKKNFGEEIGTKSKISFVELGEYEERKRKMLHPGQMKSICNVLIHETIGNAGENDIYMMRTWNHFWGMIYLCEQKQWKLLDTMAWLFKRLKRQEFDMKKWKVNIYSIYNLLEEGNTERVP
jgi:hypothetical protein